MARIQTEYRPQSTGLQSTPIPTIQTERAPFDPNADKAFQLARALGAIDANSLGASLDRANTAYDRSQVDEARKYANSLTVEDLGKRIKDGSMLPSQSPVFAATLQHIYGENSLDNFERDTASKLSSGELKFTTPGDLDAYLTQNRNDLLKGQSQYTVAGFDRSYNQMRQRLIEANTKLNDKQAVENGIQQSSDNLANVALEVTAPTFTGTTDDAAKALVDRYQLLRKTSLLRDDAAKEALTGMVGSLAGSGQKDLVEKLLASKLDSGVTIGGVLGGLKATSLTQEAGRQFDQAQRQRVDVELRPFVEKAGQGELDSSNFDDWVKKNEKYVTTSTVMAVKNHNQTSLERLLKQNNKAALQASSEESYATATQNIQAAVESGGLSFLPQQTVMTPEGEVKPLKAEDVAVPYIQKRVAESKMSFGKSVEFFSTNGVENPEWKKQIQGGVSNLASVGWTYDGKNIGQLNQQGQEAVDTFIRINKVNPSYAQKLTGGGDDYKMLSDIQFLTERFNMPLSDAAARINQIQRAGITKEDYGSLTKKVQSAVDDVVNPHWYSGVTGWWGGLWGNDQVNLTAVKTDLSRMTELLVKSGQVPDAPSAVKAATEYLANPAITTKINNTVYFNKDLPTVPQGEDPGQWVERFIKEVPGQLATSQKMNGSDVRLEPNQYGGFTAWIAGVPLVDPKGNIVTYQKDDVSKWVGNTMQADRSRAADEANFKLYQDRIRRELGTMQKKDPYALEKYDSSIGQAFFEKEIAGRDAYKRNVAEGLDKKPLGELFDIMKTRRMGNQFGPSDAPGMVQQGNIDLTKRPQVKNADGSVSTVRSMSVNIDNKEYLIPTVSDDGKLLSDEDAIKLFEKTGKHLGVFKTPEAATAYAKQLHNAQADMYVKQGQ